MAQKRCLGVHYTETLITAVSVEQEGAEYRFGPARKLRASDESVDNAAIDSPQATDAGPNGRGPTELIEQLKQQISLENGKAPPVALSLNGRLYQTQPYHSQFTDKRQFDQTLRYDIEEEFAADADLLALCYQQKPAAEAGTDLLVHTVPRAQMEEILNRFEQADMDALIAEPDVVSWLHYLKKQEELPSGAPIVVLGRAAEMLYILILNEDHQPVLTRNEPCVSADMADELLRCELPRSLAQLSEDQQPKYLLYHPDGLNTDNIKELAGSGLECRSLREMDMATACAAGVGIGWLSQPSQLSQEDHSDFRADGLPPRTLVTMKRRGLYGLSAALSLLLLVWILLMNLHSENYRSYESAAMNEIMDAYSEVYPGQKPPRNPFQIPNRIRRRLAEVGDKYSTLTVKTLPDSASNTLMLVFGVLNKLGEEFDLRIESLSVSANTSTFAGSVANMKDMELLHKAIEAKGSQLESVSLDSWKTGSGSPKDPTNRRTFRMQLRVKK
ncbi:MAG: hypothetical protein KAJ52_06610 [Sedimentisphaerales bacterium]|nr:hypothetical protein [Sedimentisphaerales bacterium]